MFLMHRSTAHARTRDASIACACFSTTVVRQPLGWFPVQPAATETPVSNKVRFYRRIFCSIKYELDERAERRVGVFGGAPRSAGARRRA